MQTLGQTTLKRPLIVAIISARENILALDKYKEIQRQLADPRKVATPALRDQLLATGKTRTLALLMLDYTAGAELEKATVVGAMIVLMVVTAAIIARVLGGKFGIK